MLRRLNCGFVTALTCFALVGLTASVSQAKSISGHVSLLPTHPTSITSKPIPTPLFTPIALVSGMLDLPSSQDPLTGWMIHNRASIGLQAVKTSAGTYIVRLSYSDTQGMSFSGNWLRTIQVIPVAPGSSIPSQINVTLGLVCKTYNDVATINITNAGKDSNGNVLYNVSLQVWDGYHKNEWVNVSGQFAPEVTDVMMSPRYR